ncbi:MAG: alpha/beta hydrolase [Erysipelotrichaceae bacterium]|nr:alpha/beta hydrolase [Erysipelotrichaceae bacterium]
MEMNYIQFGSGDKTMVILPGLSLKPVVDSAKAVKSAYKCFNQEYTVYLFDRRSDVGDSYTINEMAEDTIGKIEELELKDIYLLGVSQGGMIAQMIALKRPDLIKKIVLASTASRFDDGKTEDWIALAEEKDAKKLTHTFSKLIYSPSTYRKFKPFLALMYKDMNEEDLRKFAVYAKGCLGFDVSEQVKDIRIPTLVLGSIKDQVIAPKEMIFLHEQMPDSEIYLYEDYSHAVYDEADDFKERIMNFFAD